MSSTPPVQIKRWRFRWSLRTLMVLVALSALGFFAVEQIRQRQPVNRLVRVLQRGDASARQQAASQLGQLGPQAASAVPALKSATRDPDANVRASAIYSLSQIVGKPEMGLEPCFLAGLNDPDKSVKRAALDALDEIGARSPAVVAALVRTTMDRSLVPHFISTIIPPPLTLEGLLLKINPPPSVLVPPIESAWKNAPVEGRRAISRILVLDTGPRDPHSPDLARAARLLIDDPDESVRENGVKLCMMLDRSARIGPAASLARRLREHLRPEASDNDLIEATRLGWNLACLDVAGPEALAVLSESLGSSDPDARLVARVLVLWTGPRAESLAPQVAEMMMSSQMPKSDISFVGRVGRQVQSSIQRSIHGPGIYGGRWRKSSTLNESSPTSVGGILLAKMGQTARRQATEILRPRLREGDTAQQRLAARALAVIGPDALSAVPDLFAALDHRPADEKPDPVTYKTIGSEVASALGHIGRTGNTEILRRLIGLLDDRDPFTRAAAALALPGLGPRARAAFPALVNAARGDSQSVRVAVARSLPTLDMPPETVIPELLRLLHDKEATVRGYAAKGLAEIGEPARATVPEVVHVLRSLNQRARWLAAEALGRFGPVAEAALPALLTALDDEDETVRRSAREALDKVAPPSDGPLKDAARSIDALSRRQRAVDLARSDPDGPAIETLRVFLGDDDPSVRACSAAALGHLGGSAREAAADLAERSEDPDTEVRITVARALARVAPEESGTLDVLLKRLDDPEEPVRHAAIVAIGSMGPRADRAVPRFVDLLNDPDYGHRHDLLHHLGSIGFAYGATLPPLVASLDDLSSSVREESTYALVRISAKGYAERIAPILVRLLNDDSGSVRSEAARGLGQSSPKPVAVETALDVLELGSPQARLGAVRAARWGGLQPDPTGRIARALLWTLDDPDPDLRREAIQAVLSWLEEAHDIKGARETFQRHLYDDDPMMRHYAALAIEGLDRYDKRLGH